MKTLLSLFLVFAVLVSACTKSDVQPSVNALSIGSENNSSIVKTRSALLVAHNWMYKTYSFHYVDQHHQGDVQYERGGVQNVINLDYTGFKFKEDGTFLEIDGGYHYPGKWRFDSTGNLLSLYFQYWTDNDSVLVLNNNHLTYTEPLGYNDKIYTELITAQ